MKRIILFAILFLPIFLSAQEERITRGTIRVDTLYAVVIKYWDFPTDTTEIVRDMVWASDSLGKFKPRDLDSISQVSRIDTLYIDDFIIYTGDSSAAAGYYFRFINDSVLVPGKIKPSDLGTGITGAADTNKFLSSGGKWKTGGVGGVWGSITGNYLDQTDLVNALADKLDIGDAAAFLYDHEQNDYYDATDFWNAINVKSDSGHTHPMSKVTGLISALADKLNYNAPAYAIYDETQNEWYNATDLINLIGGEASGLADGIYEYNYDDGVTLNADYASYSSHLYTSDFNNYYEAEDFALAAHLHDDRYLTLTGAEDYALISYVEGAYSPLGHTHSYADLTHYHDDRYLKLSDAEDYALISYVESNYAPLSHTQAISTIIGLQTELNGKASAFTGQTISITLYDTGNNAYTLTFTNGVLTGFEAL